MNKVQVIILVIHKSYNGQENSFLDTDSLVSQSLLKFLQKCLKRLGDNYETCFRNIKNSRSRHILQPLSGFTSGKIIA